MACTIQWNHETRPPNTDNRSSILAQGGPLQRRRLLAMDGRQDNDGIRRVHAAQGPIHRGAPDVVGHVHGARYTPRNGRDAFMRYPVVCEPGTPVGWHTEGQQRGQDQEGQKPRQPNGPRQAHFADRRSGCRQHGGIGLHIQGGGFGARMLGRNGLSCPPALHEGLIDHRNAALVDARRAEVARNLFGTQPELPGQLDMFGGAA